jgi:hypothetical protein
MFSAEKRFPRDLTEKKRLVHQNSVRAGGKVQSHGDSIWGKAIRPHLNYSGKRSGQIFLPDKNECCGEHVLAILCGKNPGKRENTHEPKSTFWRGREKGATPHARSGASQAGGPTSRAAEYGRANA